ncbi:MAG: hypothetical protein FJX67_16660 [Alphaproteobacteria bacterium]|nr:hypothetical protein [Alphaproteobacteria bacterium]
MDSSVEPSITSVTRAVAPTQPASLRILHAAVFVVPFLWLIGHLFPPINHDAAAVLDFSRRWLEGERLYVDLIDINTPLTFLHYAVPVLLSYVTGLATPTALVVWFALIIAGTTWLCQGLIASIVPEDRPLTRTLLIGLILFGVTIVPSDEFGQREHLMIILAMPYVLAAGARAKGIAIRPGHAAFYAGLAVLGFAMKPHFAAIPVLIELYLLCARGFRRTIADPVPWMIAAGFGAHVLFILLVTPDYLRTVMPLALEYYLGLGDGGPLAVALSSHTNATIAALVLLAWPAFRYDRTGIAPAILMFALGGIVSDLAQGKGWPYHAIPAMVGTMVLFGLVVAETLERYLPRGTPGAETRTATISVVLMAVVLYLFALGDDPFRKQLEYRASPVAQLVKIVKKHAKGGRVLVLSPGIYPHYPMVNYARATMAMPFMTMWTIQGVYRDCDGTENRYHAPADMEAGERFVFDAIPKSLINLKPDVVIVDVDGGITWCEDSGAFSFLDYFNRHPAFETEWRNYYLIEEYNRYHIYARRR